MSGPLTNKSSKGRVPTGYADEIVLSNASFKQLHRSAEAASEPPAKKRKREPKGDPADVHGYKGPWAKWEEEQPDAVPDEEEEGVEYVYEYEEDEIEDIDRAPLPKGATDYAPTGDGSEKSEFHGKSQYDYQGRTYMHVPRDLDIDLHSDTADLQCYHPKKLIHTWKPSKQPVNQMRFFPGSGHLLLAASADAKIRLYDVYHDRELLRSFSGHAKSVNDIDFTTNGERFLSASYDRTIKSWDTETGKCLSRFSVKGNPHVVRWNPDPKHSWEFLAGMSNKKILQFDTRTGGDPIQEYDHHLSAVNTLTFCDENRRFMSTSDDKSMRAWEYGIPVPIK